MDTIGIRSENEVHEQLIDETLYPRKKSTVGLPWKVGPEDLSSNYNVCHQKLQGLQTKLKEPEVLAEYDEIIKAQEQAGIEEKAFSVSVTCELSNIRNWQETDISLQLINRVCPNTLRWIGKN